MSHQTSPADDHHDQTSTIAPDPLRGRDMLCFSHDWNGDPLSKTHLMRLLARDNRVLWVNSIGYRAPTASKRDIARAFKKILAAASPLKEVEPNIHVLSPLVIPAYGRPEVRAFNRWFLRAQVRRAMRRLRFQRPVNWVFNPAAAMIAGSLGEDLLIYYCVDEYAAFSGVARESMEALEREVLAKADLVIASSEQLCRSKLEHNPRTVLVRHGVDWARFRAALDERTAPPPALAGLPRPILGYFGLIAQDWVDIDLLAHVARRLPHASIVMLGKTTMDVSTLERLPNVHLLGRQPYGSLPAYCKAFDVALIPFPINEVTLNANPLKAREYLAAGLPVISTAIPEVEVLESCRIGRDHDDFVAQINAALTDPGPSAARSDAVQGESWEARLGEIRSHVAAAIGHRTPSSPSAPSPFGRGRVRAPLSSLPSSTVFPDSSSIPSPLPPLPSLLKTIREDVQRKALWCYGSDRPRAMLKALLTDGNPAMLLYRLMQRSRRYRLAPLEMLFNKLSAALCNCIIGRGAEFGPGLVLIHSTGVVINGAVRAGRGIHIEHQVTIGAEGRLTPILGDDVFLGAGAKVLGAVTIGDGARIGANAVVLQDVPAHHTAVGVPARLIAPKHAAPMEGPALAA